MHVCLSDRSHRAPSDAPSPHGHSDGNGHAVSFRHGIRPVTPLVALTHSHSTHSHLYIIRNHTKCKNYKHAAQDIALCILLAYAMVMCTLALNLLNDEEFRSEARLEGSTPRSNTVHREAPDTW